MTISALEEIEVVALQLAAADRAHLAERLLESLEEDDQILAAWISEAERCADAFDRGEIGAIDAETSLVRLRTKLLGAA